MQNGLRIGSGYDAHRLVASRPLILGGVTIPFEKGLAGHSDADVLTHALIDALLGASGLGDIGRHFSENDPRYKNISSLLLLEQTNKILTNNGFALVNADLTVVAQEPRLSHFIREMTGNIAEALGVPAFLINIKATTEEGLGFTGTGQGIAAYAVCLISKES